MIKLKLGKQYVDGQGKIRTATVDVTARSTHNRFPERRGEEVFTLVEEGEGVGRYFYAATGESVTSPDLDIRREYTTYKVGDTVRAWTGSVEVTGIVQPAVNILKNASLKPEEQIQIGASTVVYSIYGGCVYSEDRAYIIERIEEEETTVTTEPELTFDLEAIKKIMQG